MKSAATGGFCCCRMRRSIPPKFTTPRSGSRRHGELAAFPNLRVIFNLGAGVDALMADTSLPKVPLVRVAVADLTDRMTEYVVLHVLMHHRQEPYLRASQREKRWAPKSQWPANAISVGIMGIGTLGSNAAEVLAASRLSRVGLEPKPPADRRHRMLSRRGATRCISAPHRYPCLSAAADAGDAAYLEPAIVLKAQPGWAAWRAGPDQCRTRRPAKRSRHPAMPRRRHARRRVAGCLRAGTACRRTARSGRIRRSS